MSGGEIPLSWVDNWTVTGALDDNVISLDEVNFAVLTKSDTVSQLSDLYLNIDDLASALDFNGDNYISSDELLASDPNYGLMLTETLQLVKVSF